MASIRMTGPGFSRLVGVLLTATLFLALGRSYVRSHTTLIGYKLGELKEKEAILLEQRSYLQMELAKITTRSQLTMLAQTDDKPKSSAIASH